MSRKINIINFDDVVNEPKKKFNIPQFEFPLSMIINGSRNSGKTNLLINMLIGENGNPLFYYDKIYILSLSKSQKKYQFIKDYYDELAEEATKEMMKKKGKKKEEEVTTMNGNRMKKKEEDFKVESILTLTDNWEELPKPDASKPSTENVIIIFDDVLTMYERQTGFRHYVDYLYIAGRHFGYSPCFLTQSYCELSPTLRKNSTHTIIVGMPTRPLVNTLASSIPICDYKIYKDIFKKHIEFPF
jgi:hypothetical protein